MMSLKDSLPDFRSATGPFSNSHLCLGDNTHSALLKMDNKLSWSYEWFVESAVVISDTEFMIQSMEWPPEWFHFKRED
jgi:hypothetical protein